MKAAFEPPRDTGPALEAMSTTSAPSSTAGSASLFGRPALFDVGVGVLYFFTSHMVIRALYYVGIDRTPWELTVFLFTVALSIILALVALGRSAKYISEELVVSYNTTRTHVRHIYEKLNIHSKQELIDLVLFGSGVM